MTKEELDRIKKAYSSGLKVQIWFNGCWKDFDIRDYSMYSEPFSENRQYRIIGSDYVDIAEKRIEELENKIADIKANCDLAIEGRDVKIKELEQENNKLLDVINNQDVKIADLEEQIKQIEKVSDYNADQLTKAKELLKRCYENYIYLEPLRSEINQFLEEIEK